MAWTDCARDGFEIGRLLGCLEMEAWDEFQAHGDAVSLERGRELFLRAQELRDAALVLLPRTWAALKAQRVMEMYRAYAPQ